MGASAIIGVGSGYVPGQSGSAWGRGKGVIIPRREDDRIKCLTNVHDSDGSQGSDGSAQYPYGTGGEGLRQVIQGGGPSIGPPYQIAGPGGPQGLT